MLGKQPALGSYRIFRAFDQPFDAPLVLERLKYDDGRILVGIAAKNLHGYLCLIEAHSEQQAHDIEVELLDLLNHLASENG